MRLGGDGGVRSSRKGIVRARGVCGMERRRAGCGVGTRCCAERPRAELTEQGVRRHAAGGCQGGAAAPGWGWGARRAVGGAPGAGRRMDERQRRLPDWRKPGLLQPVI